MIFDANDPRLTAYALDEVDSAERAEIEQLLADCQEARTHVSEIRQTAQWLTQELQKEQETVSTLGMANHLVIEQALSSPLPTVTSRPWWRKPYRLLATAATLLICGTVGLLTWSAHQMLYYPRVEYSAVKPRQPQAQHSSTIASSDDLGNKDLLARSTTAVESEDTTHNPAEHQDKRLGSIHRRLTSAAWWQMISRGPWLKCRKCKFSAMLPGSPSALWNGPPSPS